MLRYWLHYSDDYLDYMIAYQVHIRAPELSVKCHYPVLYLDYVL